MCRYSEFFWSVFSGIRTEYGDLQSKSLCSVWMQEIADQKDSKYRHFLRNEHPFYLNSRGFQTKANYWPSHPKFTDAGINIFARN